MSQELHALFRHVIEVRRGCPAQFAAQVGTQFTPSYIIGEYINDVWLFPEALFEVGQFFINHLNFLFPCLGVFLHGLLMWRIRLAGIHADCNHKCHQNYRQPRNVLLVDVIHIFPLEKSYAVDNNTCRYLFNHIQE